MFASHPSPRPKPQPIVALCYKNFAAHQGISHIGLGVAALNTSKVLRRAGVEAHVWPLATAADLSLRLSQMLHVTHVVISAPWIPLLELGKITFAHPNVEFAINCHSNVGFLQADSNGVANFKDLIHAESNTWNIHVAGNSQKFVQWVHDAFEAKCLYLPNLYYLDESCRHNPPRYSGGTLKIGAFGATRPLKNLLSAAAAAFEMSSQLRVDLQFWISGGRTDGGEVMIRAVQKLFEGEPTRRLHIAPWCPWPQFRAKYVRAMHLLMQPSYTEAFNMVTADGVAEGIPSVVSEAIDWVPESWQAHFDDVFDISKTGRHLLFDTCAASEGLRSLESYVSKGLAKWGEFLTTGGQHSSVFGNPVT